MATRIRYSKTEDPNLVRSAKAFKVGDRHVYVSLHTVSLQFNIYDATTREIIVSGGKTKNLTVLKIQAKTALKHMGVEFAEDVRTFTDSTHESTDEQTSES